MKKHPLHYINRLAWNILRKIPRVKDWGTAFRGALGLLRAAQWRKARVALAGHFRALARRYKAAGDRGRMYNFFGAAKTALTSKSYPEYTRRYGIDTQNRAEAVEFFLFGNNTRRMEQLR